MLAWLYLVSCRVGSYTGAHDEECQAKTRKVRCRCQRWCRFNEPCAYAAHKL